MTPLLGICCPIGFGFCGIDGGLRPRSAFGGAALVLGPGRAVLQRSVCVHLFSNPGFSTLQTLRQVEEVFVFEAPCGLPLAIRIFVRTRDIDGVEAVIFPDRDANKADAILGHGLF